MNGTEKEGLTGFDRRGKSPDEDLDFWPIKDKRKPPKKKEDSQQMMVDFGPME